MQTITVSLAAYGMDGDECVYSRKFCYGSKLITVRLEVHNRQVFLIPKPDCSAIAQKELYAAGHGSFAPPHKVWTKR
jgi:hypothetical protein